MDDHPPSRKLLNAKARSYALIWLSKNHPQEYRALYQNAKRELYAKAGVSLSRRHIKHRDDGTGFCAACQKPFPCPPALKRINR